MFACGAAFRLFELEKPDMNKVYEVLARWDGEAGVWVAESDDVPGLVAEADTPDALVKAPRLDSRAS